MVTSSVDPSRTVTLARAAFPEEEAGFFLGVAGAGSAAGAADFDSPGILGLFVTRTTLSLLAAIQLFSSCCTAQKCVTTGELISWIPAAASPSLSYVVSYAAAAAFFDVSHFFSSFNSHYYTFHKFGCFHAIFFDF